VAERLGVITDTHDHRPHIREAVEVFRANSVGIVVHAGDFVAPFTADDFKPLSVPLVGVFGNNDGDHALLHQRYEGIGTLHEGLHRFEWAGRSILVGHEPWRFTLDSVPEPPDILLYGHTHALDIRRGERADLNGVRADLILNPGEAYGWVGGRATVALLDPATLEVEVVELGDG
jgi:putative phosphoesterase